MDKKEVVKEIEKKEVVKKDTDKSQCKQLTVYIIVN